MIQGIPLGDSTVSLLQQKDPQIIEFYLRDAHKLNLGRDDKKFCDEESVKAIRLGDLKLVGIFSKKWRKTQFPIDS